MLVTSRRSVLFGAAGIALTPAAAALASEIQSHDWLIVPGERVGPITRSTKYADLERHFGAANLRRGFVKYGNSPKHPAIIAFPGGRDELAILIGDNTRADAVCLTKRGGAWQTADGIRIGTPIAQLNKLNGRAFTVAGLGCGGECGYVKPKPGDKLPDPDRISLRVAPERPLRPDDLALLAEAGGKTGVISSADPLFRRVNVLVDEALVFLT